MSVGTTIRDAVQAAIITAGITSIDAGSTFVRKQPERLRSDPDKVCIVVLGQEQRTGQSNQEAHYDYPVLVVLSDKNALTAAKGSTWLQDGRETLIRILGKSFFLGLGGPVSFHRIDLQPKFNAIGFEQDNTITAIEFGYTAELDYNR